MTFLKDDINQKYPFLERFLKYFACFFMVERMMLKVTYTVKDHTTETKV